MRWRSTGDDFKYLTCSYTPLDCRIDGRAQLQHPTSSAQCRTAIKLRIIKGVRGEGGHFWVTVEKGGMWVKHSEKIKRTRYLRPYVPFGSLCEPQEQVGTCWDGQMTWTGSYEALQCEVSLPKDCDLGKEFGVDRIRKHGSSFKLTSHRTASIRATCARTLFFHYGKSVSGTNVEVGKCVRHRQIERESPAFRSGREDDGAHTGASLVGVTGSRVTCTRRMGATTMYFELPPVMQVDSFGTLMRRQSTSSSQIAAGEPQSDVSGLFGINGGGEILQASLKQRSDSKLSTRNRRTGQRRSPRSTLPLALAIFVSTSMVFGSRKM